MLRMNYVIFFLPSLLCAEDTAKKIQCKIGDSVIDNGGEVSHLDYNIAIHLSVWYKGKCLDPYEDAVCGEEALGQRIFVEEDGDVRCDCDEVNISSLLSLHK